MEHERAELLIVGAGVAGLYAALAAADEGADVLVLSKGPLVTTAKAKKGYEGPVTPSVIVAIATANSTSVHVVRAARPGDNIPSPRNPI